ncbi:hypothetical protein ACPPVW_12210 [Leifsonia sp. McL0607]|uniref:hypothetical protein n=1 Tax=Leifsonia sp. McL0607 TaxID=3415672 RepID=UPI003CEB1E3B
MTQVSVGIPRLRRDPAHMPSLDGRRAVPGHVDRWWRAAIGGKQEGHGIDAADFRRPERSMGAIGG